MAKCKCESLLNYDDLLDVGLKKNLINKDDAQNLKAWKVNPEKWGKKFI